MKHYFFGITN